MKNESLIVEDVYSLSIMDLLRSQHFSGDLVSIGYQVVIIIGMTLEVGF